MFHIMLYAAGKNGNVVQIANEAIMWILYTNMELITNVYKMFFLVSQDNVSTLFMWGGHFFHACMWKFLPAYNNVKSYVYEKSIKILS